jgi:hypothetical protein
MNFFPLPANLAVWVSLPVGEESIYVYAYITVGRIAQKLSKCKYLKLRMKCTYFTLACSEEKWKGYILLHG